VKRFWMRAFVLIIACLAGLAVCRADELAAVTGLVTDPNGRSVPGVTIIITNLSTNVASRTVTNDQGIYRVPSLQPGIYRMTLDKDGFKSVVKSGVELHVQDVASINFELQIGSVNETVTVQAGGLVINTTDAAVSTVVDRQFAENLPMNGRSFQTLIELTPGVVLTPSASEAAGQFSINGQRASANYWMVDGVSANIGQAGGVPGNGLSGSLGSFSALGGTNSLVSVDALEEFRIQTSTYAPEFGRSPGGQISIVTRSGTNQFHGTAFEYLRNDLLDASNWFNGYTNNPPLPKAQERQNDFGGTFSGPILKDRTFFFFSYEGLRLRLPQTALTNVPDLLARQTAVSAMQPFLNAFPFDPNQPDLGNGIAQFNASYSDPGTLDAYSLRIDHRLNNKVNLFGRYNYSPSELSSRGGGFSLSTVNSNRITTQTATVGATWATFPGMTNDLRLNYSRANSASRLKLDNFGGAVPLTSLPFPSGFTGQNSLFVFDIILVSDGFFIVGQNGQNLQRQINLVDNLSAQKGTHGLKFGVDYRRLSPVSQRPLYGQQAFFLDVPSAGSGNLFFSTLQSGENVTLLFRNLGLFAQDTWRVTPRLTLTYGIRWDMDFAPSSINGPSLLAVTGFDLSNLSNLALAPAGTPPFNTTYGNFAPRLGVAYQISQKPGRETVIRGGFGVFYDLATSQVGNVLAALTYPFGAMAPANFGGTFPLSPANAAPPPITPPSGGAGIVSALDPHLDLPYTLEWNVALEQGLGNHQTISASYIGSVGRSLLQTADIVKPNPNFGGALLVGNSATSDYNALQLQFQRQLSHGIQALASYTWSHSIDTASDGSKFGNLANTLVPGLSSNSNRGSSDFDIRNALSAGVTYDFPSPKINAFTNAILHDWSTESFIIARSAPPVNIYYSTFARLLNSSTQVRPDVVSGVPFYLYGSQFPGGKAFNPAAFTSPPLDSSGRIPLRQGDLSRNALRGFGGTEWDFAIHRSFPIHESIKLEFRAEMFNVLNHPNFGQPVGNLGSPKALNRQFGLSTQMLGQQLSGGNVGGGGFSPLYQIGGPRSIQLALKLLF
jgi:outer membrane receptor protein involved in Fe transport